VRRRDRADQGVTEPSAKRDGLRLRAVDQEDLQVIAACLQDALIPLREMAFMADARRFMAAFNRFQWERLADLGESAGLTRCQAALRIDHVEAVQHRGFDDELDGVKFELLTIAAEPLGEGGFQITLVFAGDVALRLKVSELSIILEDFGEPTPAIVAPRHEFSPSSEPSA
jgi:hypothetical protein